MLFYNLIIEGCLVVIPSRKFSLLLIFGCFLNISILSGKTGNDILEPAEAEVSLQELFAELAGAADAEHRKEVNTRIATLFENILKHPCSFEYPFDSLAYVGRITAPDNQLRVFTWNYSDSPADHKYFGFLQYRNKTGNKISVFFLDQQEAEREGFEQRVFHPQNWYGALYYQVHSVVHSGKTWYTLIGFDFNDIFTNIKLIDILSFSDGVPVFGAPLFQFREGAIKRVVFEYSSEVVMFLRFIPERDMIIYDHLSPASPRLRGQYRFYGPDFSYDGLKFENSRWVHIPDVDWRR
jgi:hypothetical protein